MSRSANNNRTMRTRIHNKRGTKMKRVIDNFDLEFKTFKNRNTSLKQRIKKKHR